MGGPAGPASGREGRAAGGVRKRAAELIGMPLRTLVLRLKQYGLGQDE